MTGGARITCGAVNGPASGAEDPASGLEEPASGFKNLRRAEDPASGLGLGRGGDVLLAEVPQHHRRHLPVALLGGGASGQFLLSGLGSIGGARLRSGEMARLKSGRNEIATYDLTRTRQHQVARPTPLGLPWDPRHRPTVGSQGVAFSYGRRAPVHILREGRLRH